MKIINMGQLKTQEQFIAFVQQDPENDGRYQTFDAFDSYKMTVAEGVNIVETPEDVSILDAMSKEYLLSLRDQNILKSSMRSARKGQESREWQHLVFSLSDFETHTFRANNHDPEDLKRDLMSALRADNDLKSGSLHSTVGLSHTNTDNLHFHILRHSNGIDHANKEISNSQTLYKDVILTLLEPVLKKYGLSGEFLQAAAGETSAQVMARNEAKDAIFEKEGIVHTRDQNAVETIKQNIAPEEALLVKAQAVLQRSIDEQVAQLQMVQNAISAIARERDARTELEAVKAQLEQSNKEIEQSRDKIALLSDQVNEDRAKIEQQREEIESLNDSLIKANTLNNELSEEVKTLTSELSMEVERADFAESQVNHLSADKDALTSEVEALKRANELLEKTVEEQAKLAAEKDKLLEEKAQFLTEKDNLISTLSSMINDMRNGFNFSSKGQEHDGDDHDGKGGKGGGGGGGQGGGSSPAPMPEPEPEQAQSESAMPVPEPQTPQTPLPKDVSVNQLEAIEQHNESVRSVALQSKQFDAMTTGRVIEHFDYSEQSYLEKDHRIKEIGTHLMSNAVVTHNIDAIGDVPANLLDRLRQFTQKAGLEVTEHDAYQVNGKDYVSLSITASNQGHELGDRIKSDLIASTYAFMNGTALIRTDDAQSYEYINTVVNFENVAPIGSYKANVVQDDTLNVTDYLTRLAREAVTNRMSSGEHTNQFDFIGRAQVEFIFDQQMQTLIGTPANAQGIPNSRPVDQEIAQRIKTDVVEFAHNVPSHVTNDAWDAKFFNEYRRIDEVKLLVNDVPMQINFVAGSTSNNASFTITDLNQNLSVASFTIDAQSQLVQFKSDYSRDAFDTRAVEKALKAYVNTLNSNFIELNETASQTDSKTLFDVVKAGDDKRFDQAVRDDQRVKSQTVDFEDMGNLDLDDLGGK